MSSLTEEQKWFIFDLRKDKKTFREVEAEFKKKYNRGIASSTIHRYSYYPNFAKEPRGEKDEELEKEEEKIEERPEEKEEKVKELEVKVKDTRKQKKNIVDLTTLDTDSNDFKRIVKSRGTSEEETFNFLKKCLKRGYKKVDLSTGDLKK